jgi:heterodisulfide reductase subunit A-like polyferredoxin
MKYEKQINQQMKTEVLVIGGGSAGSMAAIASGKEGRKTLLVERYGFLGGTSTTISGHFLRILHSGNPK